MTIKPLKLPGTDVAARNFQASIGGSPNKHHLEYASNSLIYIRYLLNSVPFGSDTIFPPLYRYEITTDTDKQATNHGFPRYIPLSCPRRNFAARCGRS